MDKTPAQTDRTAPNTGGVEVRLAMGFRGWLRVDIHYGEGQPYELLRTLTFVDRDGRQWTVPAGLRFDGPSTPALLRSIGPDHRHALYDSALHDALTRAAEGTGAVELRPKLGAALTQRGGAEWCAIGRPVANWRRVADDLWHQARSINPMVSDAQASRDWLAVRIGSIHRVRERYGWRAWAGELYWTWRQSVASNRCRMVLGRVAEPVLRLIGTA